MTGWGAMMMGIWERGKIPTLRFAQDGVPDGGHEREKEDPHLLKSADVGHLRTNGRTDWGRADEMSEQWDVLVVGGGPGGLAAGTAAARGGARVAVCERSAEIGSPIRTTGGSFVADMEKLGVPAELYHRIRR